MGKSGAKAASVVGLILVLAACGGGGGGTSAGGAKCAKTLQAAWIYVGPIGDGGWTFAHDQGRKTAEKNLAGCVKTSFVENVPEGPDSERILTQLARDGKDVIFATSFGYMDPIQNVAPKFPNVKFEHATGFKVAPNVGTYFGAAEEARYLSGIAAGKATKNGKLGYVAAFPIPEVLRGINAYTLGVRSVNPSATVKVAWTATWFGPDKEKQAAEALLNDGVDVLAQHQDTPATGQAAEARGAKWVGYNSDMRKFAPKGWLTAPAWDWSGYYTRTLQSVMDGTWKSEQYYGNMKDGLVMLAPFGDPVDKATQDAIAAKGNDIRGGAFAPFTGPVKDQSGTVKIGAGKVETLENLLKMDYLVEGTIGEIPKS